MARHSNNLDRCSLKRFHTNKTSNQIQSHIYYRSEPRSQQSLPPFSSSFSLSFSFSLPPRHFFSLPCSFSIGRIHGSDSSQDEAYNQHMWTGGFPGRDPGLRARPENLPLPRLRSSGLFLMYDTWRRKRSDVHSMRMRANIIGTMKMLRWTRVLNAVKRIAWSNNNTGFREEIV